MKITLTVKEICYQVVVLMKRQLDIGILSGVEPHPRNRGSILLVKVDLKTPSKVTITSLNFCCYFKYFNSMATFDYLN
jgi:hypothetical protein